MANLFQRFVREEERLHALRLRNAMATFPQRTSTNSPPPSSSPQEPASDADAAADSNHGSSVVVVADTLLPTLVPNHPIGLGISYAPVPNAQAQPSLTVNPSNAPGSSESTPQPHLQSQHQQTEAPATATGATATTPTQTSKGQDSTEASSSGGSAVPTLTTPEDVSGVNSPAVGTGTATATGAGSNTGGGASGNVPTTPGAAVGGFMGKLRGLGRTAKRTHGESTPGTPAPTPRAPGSATPGAGTISSAAATQTSTPVWLLFPFLLICTRNRSHESVFFCTTGSTGSARETAHDRPTRPRYWRAQPTRRRRRSQYPSFLRYCFTHRGGARARMGYRIPWHYRQRRDDRRRGGAGGRDAGVVVGVSTTRTLTAGALDQALVHARTHAKWGGRRGRVSSSFSSNSGLADRSVSSIQLKLSATRFLRIRKLAIHVSSSLP
jgi:hypothetical protein